MEKDKKNNQSPESRRDFFKKSLKLTAVGLGVSFFGPWKYNRVYGSTQDKPITLGITSAATGQYANSGASEMLGMRMAIDEFNQKGGVLGRKIQWIHQDTETNVATGARVAEKLINRNECNFLLGGLSSEVATAIAQIAQKYGVIYLDTNSSSPSESRERCHRVKFVWDGNGNNFAQAISKDILKSKSDKWMLLTSDYDWGRQVNQAVRATVEKKGVKIMKELMVPEKTLDFSPYLDEIKKQKPAVVAASYCGEHLKALRAQAKHYGLDKSIAWIINQQDWPDVYGLTKGSLFGIFATTWYHKFDLPGVKEFVQKYKANFPNAAIPVPGNVFYNGYMATKELLGAVERAGTVNNIAVIKELEHLKVSAKDRMQHFDAYMNPNTHQLQQSAYTAVENLERTDNDDIFKILSSLNPKDIADTVGEKSCILESYHDTPSYEI